jgi:5-(aminomethyl)-3-furanmethanol phosphate kinase
MWVVKLGGSLYRSEHLTGWLRLLAERDGLVVVPGGGPFADQVREAQSKWRFSDAAAHSMALLAMEQFGQMICDLQQGLTPASTPAEIHAALLRGETPVWMPSAMVLPAPDIQQSWDVTSDSLAAWLCGALQISQLLLVKSVRVTEEVAAVEALTQAGVVDSQLGGLLQTYRLNAWIIHDEAHDRLPDLDQHGGGVPGVVIESRMA